MLNEIGSTLQHAPVKLAYMKSTSTLGQRLETALKEAGIDPAALARDADTTDATISNWLHDRVKDENAKGALACRIATRLNVRVEWLLLNRPPMRNEGSVRDISPPNTYEDVADLRFVQTLTLQKLAESIPTVGYAIERAIAELEPQRRDHDHIAVVLATVRSELARWEIAALPAPPNKDR